MKQLVIEVQSNWVFSHRDDDELPIAALKSEIEKLCGVEIKDSSFTVLTLNFDEKNTAFSDIKERALQLFARRYPDTNVDDIVSFDVKEIAVCDKQTTAEHKKSDGENAELLKFISDSSDKEEKAKEQKSGNTAANDTDTSALSQINRLVGAAEFKALSKEVAGLAEEVKRTNTYDVFTNQCYLFSIGDGCGLTTYLGLFAKLIEESKLCNMASNPVREVKLAEYRESAEPFETARNALESVGEKKLKVVCVDISEWMDKTDNRYFKQFLRAVEKHSNEHIMVFRVPFVDKDILSRIRHSLSDLLTVKPVSFPPFGNDDIKKCADNEFKRYGFSVAKAAWEYFFDCISEEKSDGKFYGINTVKKVVRELVYQKHLLNARKKSKSNRITVNDICAPRVGESSLSGEEQLNRLVGVDGIKSRIKEIVAQIEFSLKSNITDRPCIHMRFVGNPGTGKTTVARIIGKLLKEKGILRVGAFFEYSGRDFCGRYIGETAPKTAGMCRDAYGSVMFIDEAYSLYRGDDDTRDYGREALDTLIAEMENHRNDFVVIMAGYNDDMNKLMQGNLGLASRMPYTIEFPNFTREQLYDIFVTMVEDKFKHDKAIFDAARDYFYNLSDDILSAKEFSNARFVRNLFERTWAKAAMRCQLCDNSAVTLIRDDFERATADKDFAHNIQKKVRIGF